MKKRHIIISCILVVGIIFSGLAVAESHRTGHRKGFGFKHHHKGAGLQLLARYQQKNLRVQVLSEMTEQPVEAIQLKLKDKDQHLGSMMQELKSVRELNRRLSTEALRQNRKKKFLPRWKLTPNGASLCAS